MLGADPALAVADEKQVRAALDKVDFVVVQDSFLTDTASYADVVLPAAVAAEDEGTFTNGERLVQRVRAAVPALGESLPDWKIVQSLANSLGADWAYGAPADVMSEIADVVALVQGSVLREARDGGPGMALPGDGVPRHAHTLRRGVRQGQGGLRCRRRVPLATTATDAEFPLVLLTGSVREHHGTGVRTRRRAGPHEPCWRSPRFGIKPQATPRPWCGRR